MTRPLGRWAAIGSLLALGLAGRAVCAERVAVQDFVLPDVNGRIVRLADFAGSRLVVIVFLGVDCPLARVYGPRLEELSKRFAGRDVAFLGINSNRQDLPRQIGAYAPIRHFVSDFEGSRQRDRRPFASPAHARGLRS